MKITDFFSGSEQIVRPIIFIIILVTAYIVINKVIKNYKTRNVGKSGGYNPSQLDPNFNYDNLADAVHEACDYWLGQPSAGPVEAVSEKLMRLNDDELKHVNDRYFSMYGKGTRTLYKSINSLWFCLTCPNWNALNDRLERLGLG